MALRKMPNSDNWYCYYRGIDGRIYTKSTETPDRRKAEEFNNAVMLALKMTRARLKIASLDPDFKNRMASNDARQSNHVGGTVYHVKGTISLADMPSVVMKHREISKQSLSYWNHFVSNIKVKYADEVTPDMCLKYLDRFFSDGNGKTWNNHKCSLNAIFKHALVQAGLTKSPFASISNRTVDTAEIKSRRNLTEDEIERIMEHGDEQVRCMVMLARWTAQRFETCCRMTFGMFDFDRKVFLMQPSKTKRFNEWCCIPLFKPLEDYLMSVRGKIADTEQPLFKCFGKSITKNSFTRKFKCLLDSLGIVDTEDGVAGFHSLRGSAITWMEDSGMDEEIRHAITGHRSLKVENIYAKSVERVSKAAKNMR